MMIFEYYAVRLFTHLGALFYHRVSLFLWQPEVCRSHGPPHLRVAVQWSIKPRVPLRAYPRAV